MNLFSMQNLGREPLGTRHLQLLAEATALLKRRQEDDHQFVHSPNLITIHCLICRPPTQFPEMVPSREIRAKVTRKFPDD